MDNLRVILVRHWGDKKQATGSLLVIDSNDQPIYLSPCIERGFMDNQANVSNAPEGTYPLVWEHSPKYGMVWELKDIPDGRSELKIHQANRWDQLNGCIAPGSYLGKLNNDGYYDVLASKDALKRFHKALEPMQTIGTTITIIDPSGFC
jgi:hypothetical protein